MWIVGQKISQWISVILQPLLMPLYSVALLFLYTNFYFVYNGQIFAFLFPVVLLTFIIPALFIFILKKMRYIRDYNLSFQPDRTLPYLIFVISNISLLYFFYNVNVPYWFLGLIAAPILIGFFGMIINFFWKISAHMLAIGGLVGGVLSICFNVKGANPSGLFIALFLVSGILAVTRLYLRRNTAGQVYVGFILGFTLSYISIFGMLFIMLWFKL